MGPVYRLTLRQLSGRWRLLITLLLVALPVVMVSVATLFDDAPRERHFVDDDGNERIVVESDIPLDEDPEEIANREDFVINGMIIGSIVPLVVLAIASAAFANEIEDKTLANLTLSPIPRWKIVAPKLLGAITVAGPFIAVSTFATAYIAFEGDMTAAIATTAGAIIGITLYSSVFIWAGLMTTRAIGFGLLYVFLWEGLFSGLVSGVRFLSIRHYSIAMMHGFDDRRFTGQFEAGEMLSFPVAISASIVVPVIFFLLSVRRLRRMDVP